MTTIVIGNNTGNTAGVADVGIWQDAATSPQGAGATFYLAASTTARRRAVFNFSGLPSGPVTVNSAVLSINNADAAAGTTTVELRQLLSAFVEAEATYNNRTTADAWNVAGVLTGSDVDATVIATGTAPTTGTTYFTISGAGFNALVEGWINGTITNNGVIASLISDTSAGYTYRMRSKEAADGVRPYLTIDYTAGSTPTVTTVSSNSATEGSSIVHTVTLSAAVTGSAASYAITLAGGTATGGGTDYTSTLSNGMFSDSVTVSGGNISVPVGVSTFTVTVSTAGDTIDEANETYTLTIGGTAGTGTINDDDAAPTISVNDVTESAGSCIFTVSLSAASGKSITVDYATANGTSTAGVDYTAASGTLTFAAGETTKTVTVTVP